MDSILFIGNTHIQNCEVSNLELYWYSKGNQGVTEWWESLIMSLKCTFATFLV